MRSTRRFVAILSLAGVFALDSQAVQAQEGGFQVPLNTEPVIPGTPGTWAWDPFTSMPDFIFEISPRLPRPRVRPFFRQPKSGEHLGDYLIAEQLPHSLPLPATRLPETTVPLPPHVETPPIRYFRMGSWSTDWDRFQQPKLGDLPPKPGECLGEYAIAAELPSRQPVMRPNLPTMPVPPGHYFDTGTRRWASDPPGTVPATPTPPSDRVEFSFSGPGEVKTAHQLPDGSFKEEAGKLKRCNLKQGDVHRLRVTSVQPGKPGQRFYPSMEVAFTNSKTEVFVKHAAVPVAFTEEDFAAAKAGNLVVKVIYLPNPEQAPDLVVSAEEVNSTRLEPGVDPVVEAKRRGTILAIIRMGNIDLEERTRPRSDER